MIRKFLEKDERIKFEKDFVDKTQITRIEIHADHVNEIGFIKWVLIRLMDVFGYRLTISLKTYKSITHQVLDDLEERKDDIEKMLKTGRVKQQKQRLKDRLTELKTVIKLIKYRQHERRINNIQNSTKS